MKLQLKRSNVIASGAAKIPTSAQLEYGELAINYNQQDPAIFLKDSNNNVIRIGGIGNIADDGQVELPTTTNPPTSPTPANGNLWYNSEDGRLYVYYVDGNSSQWVDASPDTWQSTVIPDITNPSYQSGSLDDRYNNKSGNATFVDRVDVGGLTVDSNLTPTSGTSVEHFYGTSGGVIQAFDRDNGNLEPLQVRGSTWNLALDGSADFESRVTVVNASAPTAYTRLYDGHMLISNTTAFGQAFGLYNTTTSAYEIAMFMDGRATFAGGSFAIQSDGDISTNIRGHGHIELDSSGSFSSPKIKLFSTTGAASFSGAIGTSGQNTANEASTLKFSQESANLSQIRAYGSNASTSGSLEFKVGPSTGTPSTPLTLNSDGSASFTADATINGLTVGEGAGSIAYNTAVGKLALYTNTTANNITAVGSEALYYNTTGSDNTAFGRRALYRNTTGVQSTATGMNALAFNTTGTNNTATGYVSLYSNTTGTSNTATGVAALYYNTTGTGNSAHGYNALLYNSTGSYNTASGFQALHTNSSGGYNTGTGYQSLYSNTTGADHVAIGWTTLYNNTTGQSNTAMGRTALYSNTTGSSNVAIGRDALRSNTTGSTNTSIGRESSYSNTTGQYNTVCGYQGLYNNTTGYNNSAFGYKALANNSTATQNTAVGYEAMRYTSTGGNNVAIGLHAMYGNSTGYENVAAGVNALISNSTGAWNTALGYKALEANTTANHNTAVGRNALISSTGSINTAVGSGAMFGNTVGNYNTAVGYSVLSTSTSGDRNVAMGYQALFSNTTGGYSTSIGMYASYYNTTGQGNEAYGYTALHNNTTGDYNTSIGYQSMYQNTTGHRNTALGLNALYSNTTGAYNVGLGRESLFNNTTGNGNPVFNPSSQNGRLVLGHTSITNAYVKVSWTVTSDERDKMNFAPVPYGLDFVNQLKPTAYQFKVDRDTETPNGDVRYGFKAQDILALEGDNPVIIDIEDPDHLKYKGEHLVPVLVNAVQELTTMVKELQAEIKTLKG